MTRRATAPIEPYQLFFEDLSDNPRLRKWIVASVMLFALTQSQAYSQNLTTPWNGAVQGEGISALSATQFAATLAYGLDTSQFPGADPSIRAQACLNALQSYDIMGGVCNMMNEVGTAGTNQITFTVNPFNITATNVVADPILQLPCATIFTNVPIVVAAGIPPNVTNTVAGRAEMRGCGTIGEAPGGTFGGTTLIASSSFQPCVSSTSIQWGGGGGHGQAGCTQVTSSISTSTSGTTGVMTVTGSGTSFNQSMAGCNFMSPATPSGIDSWGTIASVSNLTTLTVSQNNNKSCAGGYCDQSVGSSYVIWCPVVSLGATSQLSGHNTNYGISVHGMTVDAAGIFGAVAAQNWYAAEQSRLYDVVLRGYNNIGLDFEGNQPQSSGIYDNLFFVPAGGNVDAGGCVTTTMDVVMRTGSNGSTYGQGSPRQIRNFSAANGHGCDSSAGVGTTQQNQSFAVDASALSFVTGHFENKGIGIRLGAQPACNVGCPTVNTAASKGVLIQDMNGSCSNGGCSSIIDLATSLGSLVDITVLSLAASSNPANNFPNLLNDHTNGCHGY